MKITLLKTPIILLACHILLFVSGFLYLQSVDKSITFNFSASMQIFEPTLHFVLLAAFLIIATMEDQIYKDDSKSRQRLFLLGGLTLCSTILPRQASDLIPVFYICLIYAPIALLFFHFPFFKQEKPFIIELFDFIKISILAALFLFAFFYFPLLFIPIVAYAFYMPGIRVGIIILSILNFIASTYYYVMFFIMARFLSQPTTCLMALVGLFVMESLVLSNRCLSDRKEALSIRQQEELI